ncbi:MAG: OsmC family peroxiredoxin [Boseongicola sp.]|nr:MAG: OsmC family peroxiredoxin [Boseongicola sp.]
MEHTTLTKPVNNGVNVEALLGAREALTQAPPAAQFTWRANCEWLDGAHSRSTINGFFGLGEDQTRDEVFAVESDHPALFAASDNAATPLEIVLAALASCLTGGVASIAQHRGVQLNSVQVEVEGDMDMSGVLGIDPDVRNGFNAIRVKFHIDADATPEEIAGIVSQSQKRSAIYDVITNPSNVRTSIA